jgi:undecaprenyl-diphosphatase
MGFLQSIDCALFHFINATMTNSWLDTVCPIVTDLNKTMAFRYLLIPMIALLLIWKWRWRGFVIFLGALAAVGLADLCGNLIKHWVERPRPFNSGIADIRRSEAGGYSFPSNHSINMFTLATYLSLFIRHRLFVVFLFLLASLIAFTRVYNGVHFPSDVIAGAFLGILFGYSLASLIKKLMQKFPAWKTAEREGANE